MNSVAKEVAIYALVGLSSLAMLSYTVHMFIGGLVSEATERWVMAGVVFVALCAMGVMAWDIIRRRRGSA